MRRFRTIVVDGIEYKWLFRYDDYDYINDPYLLIMMKSAPKSTLHLSFPMKDHFLLNSGLPATFEGNKTVINLNQPGYISGLIRQCRIHGIQFEKEGYNYINGVQLLINMGYEINPALLN